MCTFDVDDFLTENRVKEGDTLELWTNAEAVMRIGLGHRRLSQQTENPKGLLDQAGQREHVRGCQPVGDHATQAKRVRDCQPTGHRTRQPKRVRDCQPMGGHAGQAKRVMDCQPMGDRAVAGQAKRVKESHTQHGVQPQQGMHGRRSLVDQAINRL